MKGPVLLLAALALAFATVASLGRGAVETSVRSAPLTEGWRFAPDTFAGAASDAAASLTWVADVQPWTPWGEDALLADVAGGTFRLDYHAPDTLHDRGLRIPPFYGAYRVYFDGRLVGGRGTPALTPERHGDYVASEVIALPRKPRTAIAIEAAVHDVHPGGADAALVVGDYHLLKSTEDRVVALTLFVIGLLTAAGFTVLAAAYGSAATASQRAFGALAILVAGFVAFNDTGLLAAQWLLVPYPAIYRAYYLFLFGSAAASLTYAAEAGAVVAYPRLRRGYLGALAVAAAAAVLLPVSLSSRVLWLSDGLLGAGVAFLAWRFAAAPGWREESVAMARVSLVALAVGIGACAVTEIGVDQGRGLLILACFIVFGVVGGAQFVRDFIRREGRLLAEARASEAKTQFMARVSHELRTPLHGIIGLSRMIRAEPLSAHQARYLDALDVSTTAMDVSVAGLLDYDDLLRGRLEVHEGTADLPEILREAIATGSIQLPGDMRIGLRDFSGVETFTTDARRVRDALAQLIDNAVRHGNGEHPVVHVTRERDTLRILVRSGGPTLTPEEVARAFLPFTQREGYWARERGGLGLGLSMASALARRLGGDVRHVPLERGNGFALELPLRGVTEVAEAAPHRFEVLRETSAVDYPSSADASAALATAALAPTPTVAEQLAAEQAAAEHEAPERETVEREATGTPKRRILIVEDHPVNQLLARKMVESWGYRADVVADGQAAIDAIAPAKYDLVLMDLQMPVLDGLSATRRLRERFRAEDLPIVALTANASHEDRAACQSAGMQDFLSKPFKAPELKAIVEALVGRRVGVAA